MIRLLFLSAALLVAQCVVAFDSEAWNARQKSFVQQAEHLREAYSNYAQRATLPTRDLRVALEQFPDGRVKTLIEAKKAQFFAVENYIWGEGIILTQFNENGESKVRLHADAGLIDQHAAMCWVEGAVHIIYGKTTLDGKGAFYSYNDDYCKIFASAHIQSTDFTMKGLKL